MNPIYTRLIGAVVRAVLVALGGASLSDDEISNVIGAVLVIAGVGWSIYEKFTSERQIVEGR